MKTQPSSRYGQHTTEIEQIVDQIKSATREQIEALELAWNSVDSGDRADALDDVAQNTTPSTVWPRIWKDTWGAPETQEKWSDWSAWLATSDALIAIIFGIYILDTLTTGV